MFKYAVHLAGKNVRCPGPQTLREWLTSGQVKPLTWVWIFADSRWLTAESVLDAETRKSDVDSLHDIEATMSDLSGLAEQVRELLKNGNAGSVGCGGREASKRNGTTGNPANGDPEFDPGSDGNK